MCGCCVCIIALFIRYRPKVIHHALPNHTNIPLPFSPPSEISKYLSQINASFHTHRAQRWFDRGDAASLGCLGGARRTCLTRKLRSHNRRAPHRVVAPPLNPAEGTDGRSSAAHTTQASHVWISRGAFAARDGSDESRTAFALRLGVQRRRLGWRRRERRRRELLRGGVAC